MEIEDTQAVTLPQNRLVLVFLALAMAQFTSYLDQTSVSTALPAVASSLTTGSSISWVGTSFLISSTSIQLINGRLSDILGRKACLIMSLVVMGLGNFLSGCSQLPWQLYASRAFSGFGAGAINALVQITISDITTLKQRGKYFGIIGVSVALGNGLGPVVGGFLTEHLGWRWAFWFITPMTAVTVMVLGATLPPMPMSADIRTKLRMVDWFGVLSSMLAVATFLFPISRAGTTVSWDSPLTICMVVGGIALFAVFLIAEFWVVKLPILPMRLFHRGLSANILIGANVAIGWVFWGNLFYLPLYFQNVQGWNPSQAGALILPMVIAHGLSSGLSGFLISFFGRYKPVLRGGAAIWAVATACKSFYGSETMPAAFGVVGILEGVGVGGCLQPVLVALLSNFDNKDRAVLTGLRNFVRILGGAIGITVSGTILNNTLQAGLKDRFDAEVIAQLTSSSFAMDSMDLSEQDKSLISKVYMRGLHVVFVTYAVLISGVFVAFLLVKDQSLGGKGEEHKYQELHDQEDSPLNGHRSSGEEIS
ncbi:major facilitator superfamily-domain-containing protein [Aspergillus ambiguus]|uniref:major facilitator superfamily-domain-containing protein n=1 Tax=Aspergillus ambiguus TaxID=176160 RepID=UPI003CCD5FF7